MSHIEDTTRHYDTIIIGGGISGLTAGIYTARANQRTLILSGNMSEGQMPGGQLSLTNQIDNFPGFSGSGYELIEKTTEQAEAAGAEVLLEGAEGFHFGDTTNGYLHKVFASNDNTYSCKSLIVATGAIARRLGIPGEDEFFSNGVSTCATCDGAFFEDKLVVVVGGGDTAVEDALYLADLAKKVTLVHRRDSLRTDSPESRMLLDHPNVTVQWNTVVESVAGDTTVESVRLRNLQDRTTHVAHTDGLFVAVGHDPSSERFRDENFSFDENGYFIANGTLTQTPGVYVAGDVADPVYRQAVTAAATGAQAGMNAIKYNKTSQA